MVRPARSHSTPQDPIRHPTARHFASRPHVALGVSNAKRPDLTRHVPMGSGAAPRRRAVPQPPGEGRTGGVSGRRRGSITARWSPSRDFTLKAPKQSSHQHTMVGMCATCAIAGRAMHVTRDERSRRGKRAGCGALQGTRHTRVEPTLAAAVTFRGAHGHRTQGRQAQHRSAPTECEVMRRPCGCWILVLARVPVMLGSERARVRSNPRGP